MKRTTLVILIIVIIAGGLLATGFIFIRSLTPKYNWWPRYQYNSIEPYDTKYLFEMLKSSYGDSNFVLVNKSPEILIPDTAKNSLYFNIGFRTYYDSLTIEWFADYISRGNKAFFASENIPYQILEHIFGLDSNYVYAQTYTDSVIHTSFLSDTANIYPFHFQKAKKKSLYGWTYLTDSCMYKYWINGCIDPISTIDSGRTNFAKINYGQGSVYILTTPLFLTNYFIIRENGFEYANDVFQHVGKGNILYWDNFNHFSLPQDAPNDFNPLKFFLSQKTLRWAWYLTLITLFAFILFRLKRRQKPILVHLPDKNTSIEYAKTVGLLHYHTGSHNALSEQLMKIFLSYIKGRYKINLTNGKDSDIKIIAFHSGIDSSLIKEIFTQYYLIRHDPEPLKTDTIKLFSHLEYFYKNCK